MWLNDNTGPISFVHHTICKHDSLVIFQVYHCPPFHSDISVGLKKIESSFGPGDHGSTFGGNPLATSVGVGVFDEITRPGFLKEVQEKSKYFFESLLKFSKNRPVLDLEIRGKGLMIGITGPFEAKKIVQSGLQEGFILNTPSANTLRLLPPLIIEKKQIDALIHFFKKSF